MDTHGGSGPITSRSVVSLARAIRARELSASEVVETHIECHQRLAPRINALAADRFGLARQEARLADELLRSAAPEDPLPPLLGVPFTVKESIAVTGMPQSAGLVARRDCLATGNAPAVQRLLDAGAIALGVTNTSELTLWIESSNRLYGRTNNPYDPARTAGGSSGGEGAAVGSGASPFGLASDIAGSIRLPASFCGVFGHKPSSGLVPNTGTYPGTPGPAGRMLGVGPLTRHAEDLIAVLSILAGSGGAARSATNGGLGNPAGDAANRSLPNPAGDAANRSLGDPAGDAANRSLGDPTAVSLQGLRVVILQESSLLPISRELHDARERAAGALVAAGAQLHRVILRSWRHAWLPFLATLQAEAEQTTMSLLAAAGAKRPTWRSLLSPRGPHTLPTRITLAPELLSQGSQPHGHKRLLAAAHKLVGELAETIGEGVMLHPAHPRVAPKHGRTLGRPWLLNSCAVFNLAGVPVTEVPLGLSVTTGLPLGIQVAAGMNRDHVSIAVAIELERVFGGWIPPQV